MSQMAPERGSRPRSSSSGGSNIFTHKIGPLPMWTWVAIAAGILLAWRVYAQNKAAKNGSSSTGSSTSGSTAGTAGGSTADTVGGGPDDVSSNQVPQFVNQTYSTVSAPTTVNNLPPSTQPSPCAHTGGQLPSRQCPPSCGPSGNSSGGGGPQRGHQWGGGQQGGNPQQQQGGWQQAQAAACAPGAGGGGWSGGGAQGGGGGGGGKRGGGGRGGH